MNLGLYLPAGSRLGRVIHTITNGSGLGPLTTRSVVGLLLLLYLIVGPIRESTDIVSASLTYALLIIIALTSGAVAIQGAILKRYATLEVSPPTEPAISGEPTKLLLTISRARMLPFLFLDVTIEFENPGTTSATIRISGLRGETRSIPLESLFPHRGSWEIRGIRCSLRDVSGLAKSQWEILKPTAITVVPPTSHESTLPILSSTQRPGELVVDVFNKQGEPFEVKAYHPSDGMKKIVWKAFAKRGELLSRHPEASMNPEGFVVMLVIADREGDSACAHALAYARSLASLNLDIIAGCEGGATRTPAHSPESLLDLLIDSVWDASSSGSSLIAAATALIDHCGQLTPGITVNKLLIFTNAERISTPTQAKAIEALAQWLSEHGIAPVFCLTKAAGIARSETLSGLSRLACLVVTPEQPKTTEIDLAAYNSFLTACLNRQWEVHT